MSDVGRILDERQATHGDYGEHADCTQRTSTLWQSYRNWTQLSVEQRETLHMIAHKVGRILTGNPDYPDHWDDISGYSTLVSRRLRETFMGTHQDALTYALSLSDITQMAEFLRIWESGSVDMQEWPGYASYIRTGRLGEHPDQQSSAQTEVDRLISEMHITRPGTPEDGGHHDPETPVPEFLRGSPEDSQQSQA